MDRRRSSAITTIIAATDTTATAAGLAFAQSSVGSTSGVYWGKDTPRILAVAGSIQTSVTVAVVGQLPTTRARVVVQLDAVLLSN